MLLNYLLWIFGSRLYSEPKTWWLYPVYMVCHAVGQGGINSALVNLCYDYVPFEKRPDALALSQSAYGLAGFGFTVIMSPLISAIQKNGFSILGIPVYAQQVASVIAFAFTLAVVAYVTFVVIPIKRERGGQGK